MSTAKTYSKTQIILHWLIVMMVLFQYLFHDSIGELWRGRASGALPDVPTPDIHVAMGIAIFVLMIWRVWLLVRNGAPASSGKESRVAHIFARAVQGLIYLSLFVLPLSGSVAWFLGIDSAIVVHEVIKNLLLLLIAVHIAGALAQHFVFKTDALMKMLGRA